jgi:hypothetical protein
MRLRLGRGDGPRYATKVQANALVLPDGRPARGNADLVTAALSKLA